MSGWDYDRFKNIELSSDEEEDLNVLNGIKNWNEGFVPNLAEVAAETFRNGNYCDDPTCTNPECIMARRYGREDPPESTPQNKEPTAATEPLSSPYNEDVPEKYAYDGLLDELSGSELAEFHMVERATELFSYNTPESLQEALTQFRRCFEFQLENQDSLPHRICVVMNYIAKTLGKMAHYTRARKVCQDILRYQELHSIPRTFEDEEFSTAIMDCQNSSENKDNGLPELKRICRAMGCDLFGKPCAGRCSKTENVYYYCSLKCQKRDWTSWNCHKNDCGVIKKKKKKKKKSKATKSKREKIRTKSAHPEVD